MTRHFNGPILGDRHYGGRTSSSSLPGLWEGVGLGGKVDEAQGDFKIYVEDFKRKVPLSADLDSIGWTVTSVGSPNAHVANVLAANQVLLFDAGDAADTGLNAQFIAVVSDATYVATEQTLWGPITSTATLMDDRTLIWEARVGLQIDDATSGWQSHAAFGWVATDTLLMTATTGVLAVAEGGGAGFHVDENGNVLYFCSETTITLGTDTGLDIEDATLGGTMVTLIPQYNRYSIRMDWGDAGTGKGTCQFFINGNHVGTITDSMPMDASEVFANTFEASNGPTTVNDLDMKVDYIVNAVSRPGVTT